MWDGGDIDATLDFGFFLAPAATPVSVGDFVWSDTNGNGIQDGGEPGIPGIPMTISLTGGGTVLNADGTSLATLTIPTDATGNYNFTGLAPGCEPIKPWGT